MGVSCWKSRAEVGGFACDQDYRIALSDAINWRGALTPLVDAGHGALIEEALYAYAGALCLESEGHGGPHRFTAQDDITLVFA